MPRVPCPDCGGKHNAKGAGQKNCALRLLRCLEQKRVSELRVYGNGPRPEEKLMSKMSEAAAEAEENQGNEGPQENKEVLLCLSAAGAVISIPWRKP